jgi:hypothetical protein
LRPIETKKTLQIYHQNIRGAKVYSNWNRWNDGLKWLNSNNVGIATLVETNTTWSNTYTKKLEMQRKKLEMYQWRLVQVTTQDLQTTSQERQQAFY